LHALFEVFLTKVKETFQFKLSEEMDFTKFSDENFDLKDWINAVFDSQKDANQNLEVGTFVERNK
jgi:hypothetical protein